MIRSSVAFVVVALLMVSKPLLGQNNPEQAKPAELSTVALPPEMDRVLRDYERAWRAPDAVALASLFAEDGFVLQNNRSPIQGRPAIQAAFQGHSGGPLRLRSLAFSTGGTIGYIIGAYGYGDSPGDAGKVHPHFASCTKRPVVNLFGYGQFEHVAKKPANVRALE